VTDRCTVVIATQNRRESLLHTNRVVCGDTGVAHVASALGTPSVVLFGPTDPAGSGPDLAFDPDNLGLLTVSRYRGPGSPAPAGLGRVWCERALSNRWVGLSS
jgi:hypothetical protein